MIATRNRGTINNIALGVEKNRLKQELEDATFSNDMDAKKVVLSKIQEIDDIMRIASRGHVERMQDTLALHNQAARKKNRFEIRQAELAERKVLKVMSAMGVKNPSARVQTRPVLVHPAKMAGNTELAGNKKAEEEPVLPPPTQKAGRKKDVDDVIASLGIEIEI